MEIDYSKIDNIVFGDVRYNDYPDLCDAYIESADYDGNPMSEEMLDEIDEDSQFVYESLLNYLN